MSAVFGILLWCCMLIMFTELVRRWWHFMHKPEIEAPEQDTDLLAQEFAELEHQVTERNDALEYIRRVQQMERQKLCSHLRIIDKRNSIHQSEGTIVTRYCLDCGLVWDHPERVSAW